MVQVIIRLQHKDEHWYVLGYQADFAGAIRQPSLPPPPTRRFRTRKAASCCVGGMVLGLLKSVRKDATGLDVMGHEQIEYGKTSPQQGSRENVPPLIL